MTERYSASEILAEHPVEPEVLRKAARPVAVDGGKIPVGRRREAWKTHAARLHNDGADFEKKVRLLMLYAAEMFEDPSTASEQDARGIAEWYEGRDRATDFTIEMPAQEREPGEDDDPSRAPDPPSTPESVEKFRSPVEALRAMPDSAGRLRSGFPEIDRVTRGGLRAGEVITFTGRPGSSKSTIMQQIARTFADLYGSPVVAIHADEGDGPAAVRLGQMFGLDRDKLEAKDPDELAAMQAELAKIGYVMANPAEASLEDAVEKLRALPASPTGPKVLVIDTINQVKTAVGADLPTRERFEAIAEFYKRAAREIPAIVLVGSEANRASYASQDPEKRIDPLAAAAESRAIEHASNLQIDMRPTDDETTFEAVVAKNRIGGSKPRFSLRLDKAAATLTEIDAVAADDAKEEREQRKRVDASLKMQVKIEKAIDDPKNWSDDAPGLSLNTLSSLCKTDKRNLALQDALRGLVEGQHALKIVEGPRRGFYYCRPAGRPVVTAQEPT